MPAFYIDSGKYAIKISGDDPYDAALNAIRKYITSDRSAGRLGNKTFVSEIGFWRRENGFATRELIMEITRP